MNKELHQRINEAAVDITVDIIDRNPQPIYFVAIKEAAFRGAKFGYKEAIKMAKEWLKAHYKDIYWEVESPTRGGDIGEYLAEDFRKAMEE